MWNINFLNEKGLASGHLSKDFTDLSWLVSKLFFWLKRAGSHIWVCDINNKMQVCDPHLGWSHQYQTLHWILELLDTQAAVWGLKAVYLLHGFDHRVPRAADNSSDCPIKNTQIHNKCFLPPICVYFWLISRPTQDLAFLEFASMGRNKVSLITDALGIKNHAMLNKSILKDCCSW